MKTNKSSIKTIFSILLIGGALALFSNCSGGSKENTAESAVEGIPQELKDTAILNNDEENALNKLNNVVIDTVKKSH